MLLTAVSLSDGFYHKRHRFQCQVGTLGESQGNYDTCFDQQQELFKIDQRFCEKI